MVRRNPSSSSTFGSQASIALAREMSGFRTLGSSVGSGRSTMVLLNERDRERALALPGAAPFDPMGDGRARSDKVMLPESMMDDPAELRRWIELAFEGAATLPQKASKAKKPKTR